jgi:hypothetical protein
LLNDDGVSIWLQSARTLEGVKHTGCHQPAWHRGHPDPRVATDGDVFLAYVEQVLCPKLQAGDVAVMDNLSAHKVQGVRPLIEATGAELLYLAPGFGTAAMGYRILVLL